MLSKWTTLNKNKLEANIKDNINNTYRIHPIFFLSDLPTLYGNRSKYHTCPASIATPAKMQYTYTYNPFKDKKMIEHTEKDVLMK